MCGARGMTGFEVRHPCRERRWQGYNPRMEIQINGTATTVPDNCTVTHLIETLGYTGKRVAIERNGDIVPRSAHADTFLSQDDQIEIVVAVGGG